MSRFERTYCSQCGGEFGPGDSGFSHCDQHTEMVACPACTSVSGSPRFIDCDFCQNDGTVPAQRAGEWPTSAETP